MNPKISVVMAVYNEQSSLNQAIDSILNQTYQDFEFIIIDDCSNDDSGQILNTYKEKDKRIIVIHNDSNQGLAESLNIGIHLAKGQWIARMDGDDISLPDRFEKQINYLQNHPNIDVLSTALVDVSPDNEPFGQRSIPNDHNFLAWRTFWASPAYHGTILMRKKTFLEIGGYKSDLVLEDVELWSRMIQKARFAALPEILYKYRRTPTEFDNILEKRTKATLEICRNFVSMILDQPITMEEYMILRNSAFLSQPDTLTTADIEKTISMLLNLYAAYIQKGIFMLDWDMSQVQVDLAKRITNLSMQNKTISAQFGPMLTKQVPYSDLVKAYWKHSPLGKFAWPLYAIINPKIAFQVIKSKFRK